MAWWKRKEKVKDEFPDAERVDLRKDEERAKLFAEAKRAKEEIAELRREQSARDDIKRYKRERFAQSKAGRFMRGAGAVGDAFSSFGSELGRGVDRGVKGGDGFLGVPKRTRTRKRKGKRKGKRRQYGGRGDGFLGGGGDPLGGLGGGGSF